MKASEVWEGSSKIENISKAREEEERRRTSWPGKNVLGDK